ncbi:hypothetical protein BV61_06920 [Candidatus Synechococcus spongiarum LMB bulk15M]|uniref:Uncharacterized protein n=1 Tax=Candidatus Synechococcus spongiarum LMB bulk15M TaxID=1943582 RepID=A0A1T1CA51_9SYNE|nr:hypothetical protein BV61_06920 [Candidatus Synechococcus spongiarum LMB bulk15M]
MCIWELCLSASQAASLVAQAHPWGWAFGLIHPAWVVVDQQETDALRHLCCGAQVLALSCCIVGLTAVKAVNLPPD